MNKIIVLQLVLLSTQSFSQNAATPECPAGMHFVTGKGCAANIVAGPKCPAGTTLSKGKCVALIDTTCPAGMQFVEGTGCVSNGEVPAASAAKTTQKGKEKLAPMTPENNGKEAPAPTAGKTEATKDDKKTGIFRSGFTNRIKAECSGHQVEIMARSKVIGGAVTFLIDDKKVGEEVSFKVGDIKDIEGSAGGKKINLKVQQALFGTRYTVTVNGVECNLSGK